MGNMKVGRGGNSINDITAARDDAECRFNRVKRLLSDDGFGHFYALDSYRKEKILAPLASLLRSPGLRFYKSCSADDYSDHYDYYLGSCNADGKRHGIGLYSWEWEKDSDGDNIITYFVGIFQNGQRTSDGVWYIFSSEDAKNQFQVEGQFGVSAIGGTYRL